VYLNLQMYTEALNAYEKAEVFAAGDEVYFAKAQQAYALSFIHSGKLNEQALRLIDEVLSQYPSHRGALNLLAMNAYQNKEYEIAYQSWKNILVKGELPENEKQAITKVMRKCKEYLTDEFVAQHHIIKSPLKIYISLGEQFSSSISGNHTLFVYVRQGEGIPLAARRLQVKQFPVQVEIDEL